MAKNKLKDADLIQWWPELCAAIVALFAITITFLARNPLTGYITVMIMGFYLGGIYVLFEENEPLWPIFFILLGAMFGIMIGSIFQRRLFVAVVYLLTLFTSIYLFRNNWVQRFKRKNWIK